MMKFSSSDPRSLFDVWNLYQSEVQESQPKQKASVTLSLAKTAIIRYTLPGWGLEPSKHGRVTAWESYRGISFMKGVELPQLSHALKIQQQVFEAQQVPLDVQRNYRSALNRFLGWCQEQHWWKSKVQHISPKRHPGTDQKPKKSKSQRPKYALGSVKGDFISKDLESELEAFQDFRRNENDVRQSTVEKDLRQIRLVLGWLHRFKEIPLASLSLRQMISWVDIDSPALSKDEAEEAAFANLELINEYIHWLESTGGEGTDASNTTKNLYTSMDAFRIFLIVAQFIYRERSQSQPQSLAVKRHQDVPIVQLLRQNLADVQAVAKQQRSAQQESKQIPDWTEFLATVEQMRQHCKVGIVHTFPARKSDTDPIPHRALAAIAYNYQCFILAAFFCYVPPQRQQVWRNLTFVGSRRSKDEIYANQNPEVSGYLYKEDEQWWLYLFKDEYKTSKAYQSLLIKIPNIQYQDGRCFYQYLNEWLFEFEYETPRGIEKVDGLRKVFDPQHEYVFTQRNGKRFVHASNFNKLLQSSSYEISGESLTPELLRQMFANYISSQKFQRDFVPHFRAWTSHSLEKLSEMYYDVWLDSESASLGVEIAGRAAQNSVIDLFADDLENS